MSDLIEGNRNYQLKVVRLKNSTDSNYVLAQCLAFYKPFTRRISKLSKEYHKSRRISANPTDILKNEPFPFGTNLPSDINKFYDDMSDMENTFWLGANWYLPLCWAIASSVLYTPTEMNKPRIVFMEAKEVGKRLESISVNKINGLEDVPHKI